MRGRKDNGKNNHHDCHEEGKNHTKNSNHSSRRNVEKKDGEDEEQERGDDVRATGGERKVDNKAAEGEYDTGEDGEEESAMRLLRRMR